MKFPSFPPFARKFLGFLAMWLFWAAFLYPQLPPVIHFDLCAPGEGETLLRPKENSDPLLETDASWRVPVSVLAGCQMLEISLPSTNSVSLRWKLPAMTGQYLLRRAWVQSGFLQQPIDLQSFTAITGVRELTQGVRGLEFSFDSSMNTLNLGFALSRPRQLLLWQALMAGLAALALTVAAALSLYPPRRLGAQFSAWGAALTAFWRREAFSGREFWTLTVIALVSQLYPLTHFFITIDDDRAALRVDPAPWVEQGRWLAYLLEKYLFPQPTLPYLHHLLFSFSLALAFLLLIRANRLPRDWRMYLGFAVFAFFPTWTFITEFYANMPSLNVGILLTALAVFLFSRTFSSWTKASPFWLGLQALLLALALGGYQAYMAVYLTMVLGVLLMQAKNLSWRAAWGAGAQIALVMGLAFGLYRLVQEMFLRGLGLSASSYAQISWDVGVVSQNLPDLPSLLGREMLAFYGGQAERYGMAFVAWQALLLLTVFWISLRLWSLPWPQKILQGCLWVAFLLAPFALVLVSTRPMPTRTLQALPYVAAMMSLFVLGGAAEGDRPKTAWPSLPGARFDWHFLLSLSTVIFLLFQSITLNNLYNARIALVQQFDRRLAAEIYTQMAVADPQFDRYKSASFDIYGFSSVHLVYPTPWSGAGIGTSYFDWEDRSVIESFMRFNGYANLRLLADSERKALTPAFESMPAWPSPGFVREVNGVYLIKLDTTADFIHEKHDEIDTP